MNHPNPIEETAVVSYMEAMAGLVTAPCLETKDGQVCLRLPDEVVAVERDKYRIQRSWQRGNFDPQLYQFKQP